VRRRPIRGLIQRALRLGGYELVPVGSSEELSAHLRSRLADLDVNCVLDVGANARDYGAMLRRLGYRGRIVSFEPVLATFTRLPARCADDAELSRRDSG
jgi:hypothetical protein